MLDYEIPSLEHTIVGRGCMRSVTDALEALRQARLFFDHSVAQIRTIPIRLPTGRVTSVVLVISQTRKGEPAWGVALPTSNSFTGRRALKAQEQFEIARIDRAWVNNDGTVQLSDGTRLHAVNVAPSVICRELTTVQKRIVYLTIKFVGAEAQCYRYGPPSPDLTFLDYSTLCALKLPPLKAIARYVTDEDWTLRKVSRQTIANALGACGMRWPRSTRLAA